MRREKVLEAILVIVSGFLLMFLIYKIPAFLYVSITVGLIGVFIKPFASIIAMLWFKVGDIMGFVVSKIVLGIVFFILLVPISTFYKFFNKDSLRLKRSGGSFWTERKYTYSEPDFKKSW